MGFITSVFKKKKKETEVVEILVTGDSTMQNMTNLLLAYSHLKNGGNIIKCYK